MKNKIQLLDYNPEWPKIFAREKIELQETLGNILLSVHHIGSSSIEGMVSKPCIDIIASVKNTGGVVEILKSIKYSYKGEYNIPLRFFFSKYHNNMAYHLHLYEGDHPEIELNLVFRDYLRHNPELRDQYSFTKIQLLKDPTASEKGNGDFSNYTLRKGDFIRGVLKMADFQRFSLKKVNDDTEKKEAKTLYQIFLEENNLEEDGFERANHENLILYKGAIILGYSRVKFITQANASIILVKLSPEIEDQLEIKEAFLHLIREWLNKIGCIIV